MPHELDLILTLTGGLAAALLFGLLCQRIRLSPIVGYLIAGIAVGPFTPGFTAHSGLAEQLAEVGVILLMFGVGLHFHVKELIAVWRIAVPGAIVQIGIATGLGLLLTRLFGWNMAAGLVFGLAVSVASTVVLIRVLSDNDALHTRAGHIAVGWLLVEDLFTVLVLVMLPVLVGHGAEGESRTAGGALLAIGVAFLKITALVAFVLFVGQRAIPKLLHWVVKFGSRELFTLAVLVIALGLAVGAAKLFGASMALGAFLAGLVVGQSEFSTRAASEALPMRDAFAVLFFVSMGMLLDPSSVLPNAALTLGTLAIIIVGKPLAALLVVLGLRQPPHSALAIATSLAQIGEFSFILAALARQLGVLPGPATQVLVLCSILSITLNPMLFRLVDPIARRLPQRQPSTAGNGADAQSQADHAIVVGYGPVGRTLAALLDENELRPTIIDLNHETVRELRGMGADAIYGDASQREVLEQAGVRRAHSLVFTASGSPDAVVHQATALNPNIVIVVRTTYLQEVPKLKEAGAEVVVSAEAEVALAMTEHLLRQLGATADQLDRARARVRSDLDS